MMPMRNASRGLEASLGVALILAVLALLAIPIAQVAGRQVPPPTRFEAIDVFVDSGQTPLAAYQIEIKEKAGSQGSARLVGIEGGAVAPYKAAPFYDPAALNEDALRDRIVIAAFSTDANLPTGKSRIARLHMQVSGAEPVFALKLMTAGAADGHKIEATATYAPADAGPGDGR
jgi:hypothetical protein